MRAKYDGAVHELSLALPVNKCANCGATTLDNAADEAINDALREHIGLLRPAEIRAARAALGFTQQQLAGEIGCAPESLSRWENGQILQSRVYDRMLRAFFHLPDLRVFFDRLAVDRSLGRTAILVAPRTYPVFSAGVPVDAVGCDWFAMDLRSSLESAPAADGQPPQPRARQRALAA